MLLLLLAGASTQVSADGVRAYGHTTFARVTEAASAQSSVTNASASEAAVTSANTTED